MSFPVKRVWLATSVVLAWPMLTGAAGSQSDFEVRILAAHNQERAGLRLLPLRWSANLAAGARTWSDALGETGQFTHSPDRSGEELLGENIWCGDPSIFTPESVVKLWVSERQHFRGGVFSASSRTGDGADVAHYTQIIWRATGEIGCALSRSATEEIVVCRYRKPGNVSGQQVY
ncbi:CAP domain-containing protein [Sphingomonas montana]|uniref:CAP domain-containing protein n=1 Tax=Sphingomonas montana TaxID=1843236 RepID=UPI00096C144E|nr:CAP domain-containing protein [Sphingomonas montana]